MNEPKTSLGFLISLDVPEPSWIRGGGLWARVIHFQEHLELPTFQDYSFSLSSKQTGKNVVSDCRLRFTEEEIEVQSGLGTCLTILGP